MSNAKQISKQPANVAAIALAAIMVGGGGTHAWAQQTPDVQLAGNILFRPRATIGSDAQVSVKLLQSFRDLAPLAIANQKITLTGNIASLPYELIYDPSLIDPEGIYYLDVLVTEGDEITYITAGETYVLTRGAPANRLDVVVRAARPAAVAVVAAAATGTGPAAASTRTMLDVLNTDPRFKVMRTLVEEAGLSESLNDDSAQMTLFAPTDDAFARVSPNTLAALRRNRLALRKVLQYHLLRVKLSGDDVAKAASLNTMLDGRPMQIAMRNGAPVLDAKARAARVAVPARNGSVFAVSQLLIPEDILKDIGN